MKILTFILISFLFSSGTHNVVPNKSTIKWVGTKTTGSHEGTIMIKDGYVKIDKNNLISGQINIDMNSIICTDIKKICLSSGF